MTKCSCKVLCVTVFLAVFGLSPAEAQLDRPETLEAGIDVLDQQRLLEDDLSVLYRSRFWRQDETELIRFCRDVFQSGSSEVRVKLARLLWLSFYMWLNLPVGSVELWPAEALEEYWRFLFPPDLSSEQAHQVAVEMQVGLARVLEELPALIGEEYGRREAATEPGGSSVLRSESQRDADVLWLLLGVAQIEQYMGSEAARLVAGEVWWEISHRPGMEAGVLAGRGAGGLLSLGLMLESIPEAKHPVAGRELDPRVRSVVERLLKGGDEMFRDTAKLLADERPLRESSVEAVYGAQCGAVDDECEAYLSRLYSGPDDRALRALRSRVEERVVSGLGRERKQRLASCERRTALDGLAVGRVSASSEGRVAEVEREISRSTKRIGELLGVVERMDELAPEVLDAVFAYWAEERDERARAILERQGLLTATLAAEPRLSARGNCLAVR